MAMGLMILILFIFKKYALRKKITLEFAVFSKFTFSPTKDNWYYLVYSYMKLLQRANFMHFLQHLIYREHG